MTRVDPRRDPMAPENLPKGMKIEAPAEKKKKKKLSQIDENYSGAVLKALASIEGLEVEVMKMDVVEEKGEDPMMTLVMEVRRKGDE